MCVNILKNIPKYKAVYLIVFFVLLNAFLLCCCTIKIKEMYKWV